ncbi:carboxymuconolactone decarboxylase family protein [Paractinoplanes toevensis]|uniref:Carboxymuconolactone decarboxylase n=1 Tax=Paractinoplanes toevensis TaxID=571911 RepID=A0A919W7Y9_9ACTN|nr:carboxymuconolactone decarboxylase family protein [Actinoplanes toevensis]GIM91101.1 carboxymuconolactone decarboxylase [Actinoplanes toevensis]
MLRHGDLEPRTRLMVQLAALIGGQALREYRVMLGAALTAGVTPVEVKEIVYQAVPYAGMGRVFDFLHATNEVLTEHGVQLPLPGQSTTTPETRFEKGLAVQKEIVGAERVEAMYAGAPADEQVKGHVAANLNVGNDRATLLAVITQLLPFAGYPRTLNALRALDEIAPAG